MNRCTMGAVRVVFDWQEKKLGTYDFRCLFGILLTGRDSEFGVPDVLEIGINGMERTNIYYCASSAAARKVG